MNHITPSYNSIIIYKDLHYIGCFLYDFGANQIYQASNHAFCISMPRAEIELIMGMIRAYYIISAVTVDRMLKNQG